MNFSPAKLTWPPPRTKASQSKRSDPHWTPDTAESVPRDQPDAQFQFDDTGWPPGWRWPKFLSWDCLFWRWLCFPNHSASARICIGGIPHNIASSTEALLGAKEVRQWDQDLGRHRSYHKPSRNNSFYKTGAHSKQLLHLPADHILPAPGSHPIGHGMSLASRYLWLLIHSSDRVVTWRGQGRWEKSSMLLTVPPGKRHSTTHRAMWGSIRVDQELERSEAKS